MLRRRPLRTRRAPFRRTGLKQAAWARRRSAVPDRCRCGREPTPAVGVYQVERGGFVRRGGLPVGGDRLSAGRLADGGEPLFPLVGCLWLTIGVQQQAPAERTAAALRGSPSRGIIRGSLAFAHPTGRPAAARCQAGAPAPAYRSSPCLWLPDGTRALGLLPRASHPTVTRDARRGGDRPPRTGPGTTPSTSADPPTASPT